MENKPYYKRWYFWGIIVLVLIIIVGVSEELKKENTTVSVNIVQNNEITYDTIRSIFENGGKKKTEKIVVNTKVISDDEIKGIYNKRRYLNKDTELVIWLYSNEENANKMDIAEIAEAYLGENENIVVKNYEAERIDKEKAERERKEQEERVAQEKKEQEEKARLEEIRRKEEEKRNAPIEYQNALKKAETYSSIMHMSKSKIYDQLTSEYGEGFTKEAAQFAMDNLEADWKANALAKAKSYQINMNMSKKRIYDQLTSEYGEKFTKEEAQYAIDNLEN